MHHPNTAPELDPSCLLDLDMECFLGQGYILPGLACWNYTSPHFGTEECMYQPDAIQMLFNGGNKKWS